MSEYLFDLGQCEHSAIRPARASHHGEQVFAEMWTELMAKEGDTYSEYSSNVELQSILNVGDRLTQRMATVAASFIQWIGTGCGGSFIEKARSRMKSGSREQAFIEEWAVQNYRQPWLNGGYRLIEYILAPEECWSNGQLQEEPELTIDDYATVEHVVYWLGTFKGEQFLVECKKEIDGRLLAEQIKSSVDRRDFQHAKRLIAKAAA